jgi:hypothetical protein
MLSLLRPVEVGDFLSPTTIGVYLDTFSYGCYHKNNKC